MSTFEFDINSNSSSSGGATTPASTTDNALVRWDGATGSAIQNSSVSLNDSGDLTGVNSIEINNTGLKIKDTNASHNLTISPGSNLTANRTLLISTGDSDRNISALGDVLFSGAVNLAGPLTTTGSNSISLTTTGATNLTLPTSGTLATLSNKVTDFSAPTTSFSLNSQKITDLGDPVSDQDAVTKNYADALFDSRLNKNPCRLATTGNLAATYSLGVLTATGNGALSVDGVTPSVGDRILVWQQSTATDNGVYEVTDVGSGGTPYILTRSTDLDSSSEMLTGVYVLITEGSTYTAAGFSLITPAVITLDTTDLTFSQITSATAYVAGSGLTLTGLTFAIGSGSGIIVNANSIEIDYSAVQAQDDTLAALSAYNTNGLIVQTAPDTFSGRTITADSSSGKEGIVVTDGDGVSGNPVVGVDIDSLSGNGAPDPVSDYVMIYDASSGTNQKALLGNLVSSSVFFHQVGTTPNEIWYSCALNSASTTTINMTVSALTSTMYAVPFIPIVGGDLDRMAFFVNTAVANTVLRCGIYKNTTNPGQLYPDELLIDSGEQSTASTGLKTNTISATLVSGQLYWFVLIAYNSAGIASGPTIRATSGASMSSILGTSSAFGSSPNTYLSLGGQTYGALPANFPAGATPTTGAAPAAIVRFSA